MVRISEVQALRARGHLPRATAAARLASVCALVAGLIWMGSPSASAATACQPSWTITPTKNPFMGRNNLRGVAALTPSDAWGVGAAGDFTLAEHFDGSAWRVVSTPNPDPAAFNQLQGVSAVSAGDVWAAGWQEASTIATLIEQWDGSSWAAVSSPNAGIASALLAISMDSATDGWAVGFARSPTDDFVTLTEHWNGSTWSIVPSPNPGGAGGILRGVIAASPTRAWVVGNYYDNTDTSQPLVEKWNGTRWKLVSTADLGAGSAGSFSAIAARSGQLWVSGGYSPAPSSYEHTLVEHFDGTSWSLQSTPSPSQSENSLDGVIALSPGDVWTVGFDANSSETATFSLAEHFDGTAWSVASAPNLGTTDGLSGIAGSSEGDLLAVGGPESDFTGGTLAERICPVQVMDSGFQPSAATGSQGGTIAWSIPAADAQSHSVTDSSGLGLFDSGLVTPGDSFTFAYDAAGTYPVSDAGTGNTSTVSVPIDVSPRTGSSSTIFTVTWSASPPPAGDVFDVQVKPPGGSFTAWKNGASESSDSFSSSDPLWAGPGTYSFRARIRDASGHHSDWSPRRSIIVS